jgi:hypothetical protein
VALLADFLQYLLEYLDAKLISGRLLGPGGRVMFRSKQVLAFSAATILVVAVIVLFFQSSKASEAWRRYEGLVWSNADQRDKRPSRLILSEPNPVTGYVTAKEDGTLCSGVEGDGKLVLICPPASTEPLTPHVRFDGALTRDTYEGVWTPTSESLKKGFFAYKFKKIWSPN